MPFQKHLFIILFQLLLVIGGCASLRTDFDDPVVEVIGIKPDSSSQALQFVIQLRITNPNKSDIALNGIYYQLSVAGNKLVTGTATDIPLIAAYDSTEIRLPANPSLFGSIALLTSLANKPSTTIDYELDVKVDIKNHLTAYRIKKEGSIELSNRRQSR
jgi:LEA14-like dessication related protein